MMRIGPFELVDELGRGGQGVVYRARDESGRIVALKLLTERWSRDRGRLARFTTEVARLGALRHSGICCVQAFGEELGRAYVVMELLEGTPLSREIGRLRRSDPGHAAGGCHLSDDLAQRAQQAARHVEQLARAAHAAHVRDIVHCDLKPANVMLMPDGEPVLLDFGLAQYDGAMPGDERPFGVAGTPAYMAPEQLDQRFGRPGVRTDVHALGALLYETLLLEPAFEAPTRAGVFHELLSREVRIREDVCRVVPKGLVAVVETALAQEPDQRYSTALALAEDLARVQRGERTEARRAGPLRRLARSAARHRRAAALYLISVLVGLVLFVVVAGMAHSAREAREELQCFVDRETLTELLEREARATWPALPSNVRVMRTWIGEAEGLLERGPVHARRLARLGPDEHSGAPAGDRERVELAAFLSELAALPARIAGAEGRVREAEALEARTVTLHADSWRVTLQALADPLASPQYDGLVIPPQVGLVPLGRDPESGLFEFAHPASGRIPERDARGRILMDGDAGLVFVLVPAGSFVMGAERAPSGDGNADPWAARWEGPCHVVELAPYFVSKFEVTQGQWLRLTGENPAQLQGAWHGSEFTLAHPVAEVSWREAGEVVRRSGLRLPTEAQWERAARGGARTPWCSGRDAATLVGNANLADLSCARVSGEAREPVVNGPASSVEWPLHDDGWPCTAPVGSFEPNAFGLYDVHGNVFEHVLDPFAPYDRPVRHTDGFRAGDNPEVCVARGGSYSSAPQEARTARRFDSTPTLRWVCGVRPVRIVDR